MAKTYERHLLNTVIEELDTNKELTTEQRLSLIRMLAKIRSERVRLLLHKGRESDSKRKAPKIAFKSNEVDLPSDPAAQEFLDRLKDSKEKEK